MRLRTGLSAAARHDASRPVHRTARFVYAFSCQSVARLELTGAISATHTVTPAVVAQECEDMAVQGADWRGVWLIQSQLYGFVDLDNRLLPGRRSTVRRRIAAIGGAASSIAPMNSPALDRCRPFLRQAAVVNLSSRRARNHDEPGGVVNAERRVDDAALL